MALVLAAAAAAIAVPRWAGAEEPRLIGVLRIDASGVSAAAGQKFEQGVVDGLVGAGLRIMDRATLGEALASSAAYVEGCAFGPCLRAVHAATGVERVLVARIEGVGRTYGFVVSLLDTRSGRLTAQVAQRCPVCTVEDAITTATLATIELVAAGGEAAEPARPAAAALAVERAAQDADARRARAGRRLRRLGLVGLVVAGAAVAGGLAIADRGPRLGAGLIGGGAALAISGGGMILVGGGLE